MTHPELAKREERAATETFVIAEIGDGFAVYTPADPKKVYQVTGTPETPACTCQDFHVHRKDPAWRCKHILAVQSHFPQGNGAGPEPDPDETKERQAIQEESRMPRKRKAAAPAVPQNGPAQMLLRRSVSPDGRIDSLSVEFACPVERLPAQEIKDQAKRILGLQAEIMGEFLNGRERRNGNGAPAKGDELSPAVPARLVAVAGMNGKWGRRLFITVEANGQNLKLFGNKSQLAEAIAAAGFSAPQDIAEGLSLNLPCRVTTKPSPDGKYLNVETVLPAEQPRR